MRCFRAEGQPTSSMVGRLLSAEQTTHKRTRPGMGEDVRGSMLGAFESVSGSDDAKAKDDDIATKGRSEIEQGIAQMKGTASPSAAAATPESHAEGKPSDKPQEKPKEEASTKGTAVPATTAAPESRVEGKTGDQPPSKEPSTKGAAVPVSTTAAPKPQVQTETGDRPQEKFTTKPPGPTPAPPPSPIQSRQTEPDTSRQESTGQIGTEYPQKGSQETQTGSPISLFLIHMHGSYTSSLRDQIFSIGGESYRTR